MGALSGAVASEAERLGTRPPSAARHVWLAFAASRVLLLAVLAAVSAGAAGAFSWAPLQDWDGEWFRRIADVGYQGATGPNGQTAWPFFPGLPALLRAGSAVGIPPGVTGVVLANVALLAAMWGVYRVARPRLGHPVAALAVWVLALWPASAPFGMVYSDVFVLAASVWAFVALDDDRPVVASALALVCTTMRPNGIVVALALAVAARTPRRVAIVVAPSLAALAAWVLFVWSASGDPLAFLSAKGAWEEVPIWAAVGHALGFAYPTPQWLDIGLAVLGAVFVFACARRIPPAWTTLFALSVLPSLVLGTVGLGRYTATCFAVPVAAAATLDRYPIWVRAGALACSAFGLAYAAAQIFMHHWLP